MIFKRADFEVVRSEFDTPHLPQKKFQPPARQPSLRPVVLTYPMPYLVDEPWSLRRQTAAAHLPRPSLRRPDAKRERIFRRVRGTQRQPQCTHQRSLMIFGSAGLSPSHRFTRPFLPALDAFPANPVFSHPCGLFFSLCPLFDVRLVCFQQLADSLSKTPGVWGTSATSPLLALSFAFFCRPFVFMVLQIAFPATPLF